MDKDDWDLLWRFQPEPEPQQGPYRLFRLDWIGQARPTAQGLLFEGFSCPLSPYLHEGDSPRPKIFYGRLGERALSHIGTIIAVDSDVWFPRDERKTAATMANTGLNAVIDFQSDNMRLAHVDDKDAATGEFLLPCGVGSPFRPHQSFICIVEDQASNTRFIFPCSEIFVACYGENIPILSGILQGKYVDVESIDDSLPFVFSGYAFCPRTRHRTRVEQATRADTTYAMHQMTAIVRRSIARNQLEGFYSLEVVPPFLGKAEVWGTAFKFTGNDRINYLFVDCIFSAPLLSDEATWNTTHESSGRDLFREHLARLGWNPDGPILSEHGFQGEELQPGDRLRWHLGPQE